jgi:hypothetical protein
MAGDNVTASFLFLILANERACFPSISTWHIR